MINFFFHFQKLQNSLIASKNVNKIEGFVHFSENMTAKFFNLGLESSLPYI